MNFPMNSKQQLAIVRQICPRAPAIGSQVRIFCGVTKRGRKLGYCVVKGEGDIAREATVVGYEIHVGECGQGWPEDSRSVEISVVVKLKSRCKLIKLAGCLYKRYLKADISCLDISFQGELPRANGGSLNV